MVSVWEQWDEAVEKKNFSGILILRQPTPSVQKRPAADVVRYERNKIVVHLCASQAERIIEQLHGDELESACVMLLHEATGLDDAMLACALIDEIVAQTGTRIRWTETGMCLGAALAAVVHDFVPLDAWVSMALQSPAADLVPMLLAAAPRLKDRLAGNRPLEEYISACRRDTANGPPTPLFFQLIDLQETLSLP